ncbi:MAG: DUF5668 domain-containing protein [Candidatus Yanofskybacteria bacterium]|nr:DUF5668 domain-containing protein [Candidatus Yanofskybacteria bacterium]
MIMLGFILIVSGILFLLKNLGLISGNVWDTLWPALLIAAGANLIIRKSCHGFFWEERFGWRKREIDEKK